MFVARAALAAALSFPAPAAPVSIQDGELRYVPPESVQILDGAWGRRIDASRAAAFGSLLDACTGRVGNFRAVAAKRSGGHVGGPQADADVYRLIEAIAGHLRLAPDAAVAARVEEIIAKIAAAQTKGGYLATYVQLEKPRERWRDPRAARELFCAGALFSAAVAWEHASGSKSLLEVATKCADAIDERFRVTGVQAVPGRCGIEAALVTLSQATGEERYLELARTFFERRGDTARPRRYGVDLQDDLPIFEQRIGAGQVVNGTALYAGVAEMALATFEQDYVFAAQTFWDDVVRSKTYVTGAVGAGEPAVFGPAWERPLEAASCPTLAAVGMLRWAERQFLVNAHATHADAMETLLCNALPAALGSSGACFERLALADSGARAPTPAGDASLETALELARWMPGFAGRVLAQDDRRVFVMQYLACSADIELAAGKVRITQETGYPASGKVVLRIEPEHPMSFILHVRAPGWCREPITIGVGDALTMQKVSHGDDPGSWLTFNRRWDPGDRLTIELPLAPERVRSHDERADRAGLVALRRGPRIYAFAGADDGAGLDGVFLPGPAELRVADGEEDAEDAEATPTLRADGVRLVSEAGRHAEQKVVLDAFAYAEWGLRAPLAMRVWLPDDRAGTRVPGETPPVRTAAGIVRGSHASANESLAAIFGGGKEPSASNDPLARRFTFLDHRGTREWLTLDLGELKLVESSAIYWYANDADVHLPAAWRIDVLQGEEWKPVKLLDGDYAPQRDGYDIVRFAPVATRVVRLSVDLADGASAGLLAWRVGARARPTTDK